MPTALPASLYFQGQGLLWASRVAIDGQPLGYRAVGNVSSLVLTPSIAVVEQRAFFDKLALTENDIPLSLGGKLTANLESLDPENVTMLTGDHVIKRIAKAGETMTGKGYSGAYMWTYHVFLLDVSDVMAGAIPLTPYSDSATPYDYRVDENAGLIYVNDGAISDVDGLRTYATPVTAYSESGGYLRVHTAIAMAKGDTGLLISPGDTLGTKPLKFVVRDAQSGYFDTNIPIAAVPALAGQPKVLKDGFPLTLTYAFDSRTVTAGQPTPVKLWSFIFQGLNGVDDKLHNIRIPRAYIRAGYSQDLINEDIASLPLEAIMLYQLNDVLAQLFTIETLPQGFRPVS